MRLFSRRFVSVCLVVLMCAALIPTSAFSTGLVSTDVAATAMRPLVFGAQTTRVQGLDRLETCVGISQRGWENSDWVVIATARDFPDAMVAGPLAATLDAPVLLAEPEGLSIEVANEIRRLGATKAIIVGGTSAVPSVVAAGLSDAGISSGELERLGGSTRYETARLVALKIQAMTGDCPSIVLATGEKFPDALSASGFAGANGMPILLTESGVFAPAAVTAIEELNAISTLVVGGEDAISSAVETLAPHPTRIGGEDRYETSKLLAEFAFANGFSYSTIVVATGADFPDALCAGPLAASIGSPVILTDGKELSSAAEEFFNSHCTSIKDLLIIGGPSAIGPDVESAIEAAAITELSPQVEVVTSAVAGALETISPDGSQMVFDASSPLVGSFETSQVLVSGPTESTPSGFLRKITGITEMGGLVTVETTQATLDEVIIKGSLDVTGSVDPNEQIIEDNGLILESAQAVDAEHIDLDLALTPRSNGTPTKVLPVVESGDGGAAAAGVIAQETMGGSVSYPFELGIGPVGEDVGAPDRGAASVRGRIGFTGSFSLNASWGHLYYVQRWWGRESITGLQSLSFVTYLNEVLELDLSVNRDVAFTIDIIKKLEERVQNAVPPNPGYRIRMQVGSPWFWIGWVPVNVTFYVTPVVKTTVGVNSLDLEFNQSSSVTFGMQYNHWSGWSPIAGSTSSFAMVGPVVTGGNAQLQVGATVDALFYNTVGPYFGVSGSLRMRADTTTNPWWTANASVEGLYGGKLDIFGRSFAAGGEVKFWERVIAAAPGAFPTPGVVWWPTPQPVMAAGLSAGVDPAENVGALASMVPDLDTLAPSDFSIYGLDVLGTQVLPDGRIRLTTSPQARSRDYVVAVVHDSFRSVDDLWVVGSSAQFAAFTKPEITSSRSLSPDRVEVSFDSYASLDALTVDASDFTIPGLVVNDATLEADGRTVTLGTTAQSEGSAYAVSMGEGVLSDAVGFPSAASTQDFVGYRAVRTEWAAANTTGTVTITFSSYAMLDAGTLDPADFSIAGLAVTDVALEADGRTVTLQTAWQTPGSRYTVTIAEDAFADGATFRSMADSAVFTGYTNYTIANGNMGSTMSVVHIGSPDGINVYSVSIGGQVRKSTNGGLTWGAAGAIAPTVAMNTGVGNSYDIAFLGGDPARLVAVSYQGVISRSTNSAATWQYFDDNAVTTAHNGSLAFNTATHGIAVHTANLLESNDGGVTWTRHAQDGTIAGVGVRFAADGLTGYIAGASGQVWRTIDGGATWALTSATGTTQTLQWVDVSPGDPGVVVATGANGTIVRSDDGGATWQACVSGTTLGLSNFVWADDSVVFAGGVDGVLLLSRDAGRTWTVLRPFSAGNAYVRGVWARDALNFWAAGLNGQNWKITGN